jgi:tRNA(His) guanylyltransferase
MHDNLGDRMKRQYEDRTRVLLPRRTYTVIRADGKAFHTFTRRCEKPHDYRLANAMDAAALALCVEAQGALFGYVQSDEISVVLQDFATIHTDAWFDGNLQKIVSVAASVVTAAFNGCYYESGPDRDGPMAVFDARVFTIPDPVEVENYFIWRMNDAERNSLSGLAQAHFSPKALHGQGKAQMHDMLHSVGVNWNDYPADQKRGRGIVYEEQGWRVDAELPVWVKERNWLTQRIPRLWESAQTNPAVDPQVGDARG